MKLYYQPENNTEENTSNEHVLQGHDIRTETKNQHEKMKNRPFKDKLIYFIDYYKFVVLGVVAAIVVLFSIIHAVATHKDYGFVSMMVNSSNIDTDTMAVSFSEYADIDTDTYDIFISANVTDGAGQDISVDSSVSTRFAALMSSQDLDVVVYDSKQFYLKALNSVYADLNSVLSKDDIEKFSDKFYYIDAKDIERAETDESIFIEAGTLNNTPDALKSNLKKHMDPSSMEEPIAIGIVITDAPFIKATDCYFERFPVFGIIVNSKRPEKAIDYLHFLYEPDVDFNMYRLME